MSACEKSSKREVCCFKSESGHKPALVLTQGWLESRTGNGRGSAQGEGLLTARWRLAGCPGASYQELRLGTQRGLAGPPVPNLPNLLADTASTSLAWGYPEGDRAGSSQRNAQTAVLVPSTGLTLPSMDLRDSGK